MCAQKSILHLAVDLGQHGEKTRSEISLAKPHQAAVEPGKLWSEECLTFLLALAGGYTLSWKAPAVACSEATRPVSDQDDPHPQTGWKDPSGVAHSQEVSSDIGKGQGGLGSPAAAGESSVDVD